MEVNFCPEWLLRRMHVPERLRLHVAILLSSAFVLAISPVLVHVPHVCLMQSLFHLPCPGCGIMHSLIALGHLRFAEAWASNPAGIFLAAYLGLQISARAAALAFDVASQFVSSFSLIGNRVVVTLLLVVWGTRLFHI